MNQPVESNASSSSRWWEFYFVRYSTGTVIGGIIFYFLCITNPILKTMLLGKEVSINGSLLALYAAYGLTFCYIASAPILVMHTGRFLFIFTYRKISLTSICSLVVPPMLITISYCIIQSNGIFALNLYTAAVLLLSFIIWVQIYFIILIFWKQKDLLFFYQELSKKRSTKDNFVESYKHLREHGNSFLIIVFEFFFGAILYIFGNYHIPNIQTCSMDIVENITPYVTIFLIWIAPAALVWFIGAMLERSFCDTFDNNSKTPRL